MGCSSSFQAIDNYHARITLEPTAMEQVSGALPSRKLLAIFVRPNAFVCNLMHKFTMAPAGTGTTVGECCDCNNKVAAEMFYHCEACKIIRCEECVRMIRWTVGTSKYNKLPVTKILQPEIFWACIRFDITNNSEPI